MARDRRWLVTGASGLLGRALTAELLRSGDEVVAVRHTHPAIDSALDVDADIGVPGVLAGIVDEWRPTHVVHAAGLTNVDRCEADEAGARRLHVDASAELARSAAAIGAAFVYISTDHLWRGEAAFVDEDVPPEPINAYARTKLAGELASLREHEGALVVRTNFIGNGPPWRPSFSDWALRELRTGGSVSAFRDAFFTPVALELLCPLLVTLTTGGVHGVLHVAGGERLSKLDLILRLGAAAGLPTDSVVASSLAEAGLAAPRPRDMSLDCGRAAAILGQPLPDIDTTIAAVLASNDAPAIPSTRTEASGP